MLKRLMHDHKHIAVLLNVLKNKQMKLSEGEAINFIVVRDIVEYMQEYAERSHHPIEDIIYAYYLAHKANDDINKLSNEHETVIQASATLMNTLNLILSDIVVAREKLITDFAEYVELQERHMQMEEREIFPLLAQNLTEEDWLVIEEECQQSLIDDPLFLDREQQAFDELRSYLSESE
ncbi:hemerythrin domain-containing protein [Shewanella putrefaciens]|uniref:Hemerythrin domain-containing protein n=1 Tax=Shewanella putrefaciens TaxID=24 RepID=A0ABX8XDS3_SHEPU|nr:hemerythrin domain-containing protein [Shewanella putrefaciens]AVV83409.1 hemerythrin [Shewanella putrefaciens]MCT8942636.1 hemerythrin domain-containing protein [Shewanella putrefaciens]QSE50339.1 hemerythrin domain-containing protein [Shewanella putrefaciens]QYX73749.1 hemerythrin domain-containing protein [Shewanella putrefaciens]GGN11809.1 hemerythrin [Shewanella putrefaciens]